MVAEDDYVERCLVCDRPEEECENDPDRTACDKIHLRRIYDMAVAHIEGWKAIRQMPNYTPGTRDRAPDVAAAMEALRETERTMDELMCEDPDADYVFAYGDGVLLVGYGEDGPYMVERHIITMLPAGEAR